MAINPIQSGLRSQSVQANNFMDAARSIGTQFQARLDVAMLGGSRSYDKVSARAESLGKIFKSDPTVMSYVNA